MRISYQRWLARMPPECERGAATAEFAIILPSVIAIAGLLLALGRVVTVSMDCQSAAAAAAREFVVSDDESAARRIAGQVADGAVRMTLSQSAETVKATVECPVLPGPMDLTPVRVTGQAVASKQ